MLLSGYNNFDDVIYKGTIQAYLHDKQIARKYVICSGAFAQGLEDYQNNVGYTATSPIAMSSAVKMAFDLHPYVKLGKILWCWLVSALLTKLTARAVRKCCK